MEPETPAAPAESDVIRLAREAMDMTALAAAEASRAHDGRGVSVTYWRDVERGYGGRRGQRVPVRASSRALAAMARVVGVAPAQLTGAGREDAARVLEEILRRERPVPSRELPPDFPVFTDKMKRDSDPYVKAVRDLVELARRDYPSGPLTGKQVFPLDPRGAVFWDGAASVGWRKEEGTIKLTAAMLAIVDAEDAAAREGGTETGLARGHSRHARRKHLVMMRA